MRRLTFSALVALRLVITKDFNKYLYVKRGNKSLLVTILFDSFTPWVQYVYWMKLPRAVPFIFKRVSIPFFPEYFVFFLSIHVRIQDTVQSHQNAYIYTQEFPEYFIQNGLTLSKYSYTVQPHITILYTVLVTNISHMKKECNI